MPPAPPPPARSILHHHRQLSPTASLRISPLCLGTMNFGDAWKERMGECNKETSFAILDEFLAQGGNYIDTANAYQSEETEEWLGEWMESRGVRDQIVLATKYSGCLKGHEPDKILSNFGGNNSKSLRISLDASLRKLKTEYIDIFYVHWWDFATTVPELMHALNDIVSRGKVLYLGISDTPSWVVAKANQYARDHGLRQFVVYQGMWNASIRDMERDIVPMCRDEGMGICAYGALGQGRFLTKAERQARESSNPGRKGKDVTEQEARVSEALERVATRRQTAITSIALAYIRAKSPYVTPIVGGRKLEHLKGNIEALNIELSKEDVAEIDGADTFDPGFPYTFLSGTLFTRDPPRAATDPSDVWLLNMMGHFEYQ